MSDFGPDLLARLKAAEGVSALLGDRLFWGFVKQGTAMPHGRLTVISDPRPEHLEGYDDARRTRVQVDVFAARYAEARTVALAIIAALDAPAVQGSTRFGRIKAEGPFDQGEDVPGQGFIHRARVDLLVSHSAA